MTVEGSRQVRKFSREVVTSPVAVVESGPRRPEVDPIGQPTFKYQLLEFFPYLNTMSVRTYWRSGEVTIRFERMPIR